MELLLDKRPFYIDTIPIAKFTFRTMGFFEWVKVSEEASAVGALTPAKWRQNYLRARMMKLMRAIDANGTEHKLDEIAIAQIPLEYAKAITSLVSAASTTGAAGKLLSPKENDGITVPILYELGTPIRIGSNEGEVEVKELEFMASTWGQIEDVIAETSDPSRAAALIRTVAKPIMTDITAIRLPEFALSQITVMDGIEISERVLPRFLDSDESSQEA